MCPDANRNDPVKSSEETIIRVYRDGFQRPNKRFGLHSKLLLVKLKQGHIILIFLLVL